MRAGGKGEVYRARDTKLDRDVALKVLPQAFTEDPDRLARFEREATVLASLTILTPAARVSRADAAAESVDELVLRLPVVGERPGALGVVGGNP